MDENKYSIIANNISKGYKMYSSPKQKLLDLVLPRGAGKTFYALKDISFKVKKGEVVGLLGLNGSGKSTLSNILGGVSMPTSGDIQINGEASLIAIGIGMNNFLTGIENIELKALMMGYKKDEIEEIKQEIIDFADIGEFINQPLRTYSSGMRARLGFAISVYTNPDILVIDEALSVGDPTFTQKCLDKMNEFKECGKTIFFVSHSLQQVKEFCNKAMWLEYGALKEYGDVDEVLPKYQAYVSKINKMTQQERLEYKKEVFKNQEHSLLKEFKLIDNNLKKFEPIGKVIKRVILINNENEVKNVFFNIDISTLAFGFIPSLIRKRYETAIFVLLAQILNIFIVSLPFSLITNFIVTSIAALFTSKSYINYLIEQKKFIPHNIWKKINGKNKNLNEELLKSNKDVKKIILAAAIYIFINSVTVLGYGYKSSINNSITNGQEIIDIKNYAVVAYSKDSIDSILILNSKGKDELTGIVYPGEIQVEISEKVNQLNNLVNTGDIEALKDVFNENFNISISDFLLINKNDIYENYSGEEIDFYKTIILNLLQLNEGDLDNAINEIENKYPNINRELIKGFYNEFQDTNINITNAEYEVILLGDIIEEEVLLALDLSNLNNHKLLSVNKRILVNNELVININEKYNEYLNENQEEAIDSENIDENLYYEEYEYYEENENINTIQPEYNEQANIDNNSSEEIIEIPSVDVENEISQENNIEEEENTETPSIDEDKEESITAPENNSDEEEAVEIPNEDEESTTLPEDNEEKPSEGIENEEGTILPEDNEEKPSEDIENEESTISTENNIELEENTTLQNNNEESEVEIEAQVNIIDEINGDNIAL